MIKRGKAGQPAFPLPMKKLLIALFLLSSSLLFASGAGETPRIGVAIYDFNDSFMSEIRNAIADASKGRIPVTIFDAEKRQQRQNEQIESFIENGYDAIIVNSVDRTASGVIIEKCRKSNVPIVFINREPVKDDMAKWDKVYYVGAHAEDAGRMAASILEEYWFAHPEADKNDDGILQFAIIKGETGHQDTELRTEYFIETLLEAGISLEKLNENTGEWTREKGRDVMNDFLSRSGDSIEAVFANNDDMALGAIEALEENGYFQDGKYIPVIGIDGTPAGREALEEGTLLGTVYNDAYNQGNAAYNIAFELASGRIPTEESIGYEMNGKYVWIAHSKLE